MKGIKDKIILNIITIFWVVFMSVNSLLGAFIVQTYHIDFFSESKGDQVMTMVNCLWVWTGTMISLMLTLGKRVQKNESVFDVDPENPLPTITQTKETNEKSVTTVS